MITQVQLIKIFLPYLEQNGRAYQKFQQVKARHATAGEIIDTVTADGFETKNTAGSGDYVVQNRTNAREQYLVKGPAFHQKYQLNQDAGDGWKLYDSKGQVLAVEVTEAVLAELNWQTPFYFEAPWKEEIVLKTGDFLVTPLPDRNEIYRIARKEFFETYKSI